MSDVDDVLAGLGSPTPSGAAAPDDNGVDSVLSNLKNHFGGNSTSSGPYVSHPLADRIIGAESGGNPNAHAAAGTAGGAGQFIDSTWVNLMRKHRPDLAAGKSDSDLTAMKTDPGLSKEMVNRYIGDNTAALPKLGVPVNDGTLSGAHWFGPEGFAKIYNSDPETPIEDVIGKDVAAQNGLTGKTTHDVENLASRRVGGSYMEKDLTLSKALSLAAHNALPSVAGAAAGVAHAVTHPTETLGTIEQIGKGLYSKAEGYANQPQDPDQKAKDEDLINRLVDSKKSQYSTWEGFLNHMANDPADMAMDAMTVSGAGGGALGVAGKGLRAAGLEGAGAAAEAAGQAVGSPARAVSSLVNRPAQALDKAGNVTPKVDALIQKVTNGAMSGSDLVDPAAKKVFAETVGAKPLSEASVKEGLLKSLGLKAPSPVVTGVAAPLGASERVAKAIEDNNELLGKHAEALSGTSTGSEMGAALDKAHTASLNGAAAKYEAIRNMPGSFGPRMPDMGSLGGMIKNNLMKSGIPTVDLKALRDTGHTQAANAIELINNYWGRGRTLLGGDVNGAEVLAMRKGLNGMAANATGSDVKAVHDIADAFDRHVATQANMGRFVNPATRWPINGLGQQIKAANQAYKRHFSTFDESANPAMRSAVNQLRGQQTIQGSGARLPSGNDSLYKSVQSGLANQLLDPAKGANTYDQLARATGNSPAMGQFVKSSLLDSVGKPGKIPKKIADVLSDPGSAAAKSLNPAELSQVKHLHAASVLNNSKPSVTSRAHSLLSGVIGGAAMKGLAGFAGYETLGPAGVLAGPMVEGALEKGVHAVQSKRALQGAPGYSRTSRILKRAVGPTALATEHYSRDPSIKPARASGGRVDIDSLVNRLISRWKSAKKATDETTKPLLNMPDTAVAHALKIAQEHI